MYQSIDDVFRIRVVLGVGSLPPNEVHDLVLSLSRNGCIRNDDLHLHKH